MKSVIFSFIPAKPTSMVASTRVARFVSETLEIPLVWDETIADYDKRDVLFIVNGAYAFCKYLEQLSHAIVGAKRIVWIQQDYSIVPPINDGDAQSPFRKAFVTRREQGKPHLEYWTTCEKESKATPLSSYINWNCLTMEKPLRSAYYHNTLIYYGSYRTGRTGYFDRYFATPQANTIISSPSKKFAEKYQLGNIKHIGIVPDLCNWLREQGFGLYLEDKKSSREFHSPPNRFYEMMSAGLPMVFPQECCPMLRKAGYNPEPWVVKNEKEIRKLFGARDHVAYSQHKMWAPMMLEERNKLGYNVRYAFAKLEDML
jgi:hypothetical protein